MDPSDKGRGGRGLLEGEGKWGEGRKYVEQACRELTSADECIGKRTNTLSTSDVFWGTHTYVLHPWPN